ncbi:MAG: 5-formyltetrahydrofolate cyclo-ligase [Clostridia bacterium]|nr:5-formyltetrahydrofolate cyclo-ligase [Clostridia bacterium]
MINEVKDIRPIKTALRNAALEWRKALTRSNKQRMDFKIQSKVMNLWKFREVKTVLLYCSKPVEIDTKLIIERAMALGKTVAVPRCIPDTRDMDFYIIHSFSDLVSGAFGVMEPDPEKCEKLTDFEASVCIVPALVYDKEGYRLGYGKGYYDRFLSGYRGSCIGLAYSDWVKDSLPHGKFDRKVDIIVTEKENYFC